MTLPGFEESSHCAGLFDEHQNKTTKTASGRAAECESEKHKKGISLLRTRNIGKAIGRLRAGSRVKTAGNEKDVICIKVTMDTVQSLGVLHIWRSCICWRNPRLVSTVCFEKNKTDEKNALFCFDLGITSASTSKWRARPASLSRLKRDRKGHKEATRRSYKAACWFERTYPVR